MGVRVPPFAPSIHISKDLTRMQTSLETLGELERRLTMSVPVAEIETEIQQRLARLAKNVKVPGFRPGKVPIKMVAQQYGPQVRSDVISDAVKANFADADPRKEPAHRRQSADRAEARSGRARPARILGDLRDLSGSEGRRPLGRHHRAGAGGCRRRRTSSGRSKCCAGNARATSTSRARAAEGDRVTVDFKGKTDGVEFPGARRPTSRSSWAKAGCCRSSKPRSPA